MILAEPPEIAALLQGRPLIIMLDIDGTLCDIATHAGDARIPEAALESLRTLGARKAEGVHVVYVTGRSVRDAHRMLGVPGAAIYGNHGMERSDAVREIDRSAGDDAAGQRAAPEGGPALRAAATQLASLASAFPGTSLEDKGLTLSFHYRAMDEGRRPELRRQLAEIVQSHGLRTKDGKCVFNIVPPDAPTKADAVREIVRDLAGDAPAPSLLFVGDDITDEDGFRALRDVDGAVTVHVGSSDATSAARYSMDGPAQVHELLGILAGLDS
ncbi:MAG: trehalose-phosphatase [Gemmatimonadaceae bacterium]